MKKLTKLLCLVLALAMVLSLTACNGGGENSSSSSDEKKNQSSSSEDSSSATTEDTATDSKASFKVVTVRWTDAWPTDFLESGVMKEIEEKTGVNTDWQVYYNADWSEQKSLLLASGDLPDAFWGSICLTDTDVNQNKALFTELTDLIDANMPNLNKVFETEPSLKAVITDRNGKIYSLPKKLPLRPQVNDVMYINKTWLDALNLKMPETYEDLATVLEAFATKDPNGNGKNDEFGYSAVQTLGGDLRHLLAPFGTMVCRDSSSYGTNFMALDSNSKPIFMPIQDNYKEAVKWAHDLYTKGLLDPECFTQDRSMVTAKTQDPNGSLSGIVFGWTADAQVGVNAKDYAVVPAIAGPDGKRYAEHNPEFLDVSRNELLITTQCKDPATLLKWADAYYNDEVSLQTFYGSVSDGKIKATDKGTYEVLVPEDGSSLDTSAWSFSMRDFGPKYMNESFYKKVMLPPDQGDGVKLAQDAVNEKYIVKTFPVCSYTEDQTQRLASLTTNLFDYCESQYAHWVVDGGIDNEWDAYLQQLDAMGLQELLTIQTDAYNAYQESVQ